MFDLNTMVRRGSASNLKPPIICIHGIGGVGKTTFAANAPNILMVPVEDGLGILETNPNVTMTTIPHSYWQVEDIIDSLISQDHQFQWLCVDSMTSLEKKLWDDLCAKHRQESIESFGYGKGFNMALEIMSKFILKLRQLRDQRGVGVILIAHSNVTTISPPDKDPYDRYTIQLNKKLADFLYSQCDLVGFCEKELMVKTDDSGFASRGKAVETGNRIMHCYSTDRYMSKNRYGMEDRKAIPLDFNYLMQAIGSQIPAQPQQQEAV